MTRGSNGSTNAPPPHHRLRRLTPIGGGGGDARDGPQADRSSSARSWARIVAVDVSRAAPNVARPAHGTVPDRSVMAVVSAGARSTDDATCFGRRATITGTDHADVIEGTTHRDVILAGDGNDQVDGMGGNDLVCGGPGDDFISGGDGQDRLDGGPGDDGVYGRDGADLELGGPGNDELTGGGSDAGADDLRGGSRRRLPARPERGRPAVRRTGSRRAAGRRRR